MSSYIPRVNVWHQISLLFYNCAESTNQYQINRLQRFLIEAQGETVYSRAFSSLFSTIFQLLLSCADAYFSRNRTLKPGFHQRISTSTRTCVSKWKLGRHKYKHKHKKNGQVRSFCACAYAYVVALTSENGVDIYVDISISISTRPWTNHMSLWPRPHASISKAIWRTNRPPSCLSSGWGELVSRIESNMPFCACVCPYGYAYAVVKTRL